MNKLANLTFSRNAKEKGEATTSKLHLYVSGLIKIKRVEQPKEFIRIGLCLKAKNIPKCINTWDNLLQAKTATERTEIPFQIPQSHWFSNGYTWFVATATTGQTKFELELNPSALLPSGFTVEIFLRSTSILREIRAGPELAAGGRITFCIEWTPVPSLREATPIFTASKFNSSKWEEQ